MRRARRRPPLHLQLVTPLVFWVAKTTPGVRSQTQNHKVGGAMGGIGVFPQVTWLNSAETDASHFVNIRIDESGLQSA